MTESKVCKYGYLEAAVFFGMFALIYKLAPTNIEMFDWGIKTYTIRIYIQF